MDVHQRRQEIVTITTGSAELDRVLGGKKLAATEILNTQLNRFSYRWY